MKYFPIIFELAKEQKPFRVGDLAFPPIPPAERHYPGRLPHSQSLKGYRTVTFAIFARMINGASLG
jgi:hypothetical protein